MIYFQSNGVLGLEPFEVWLDSFYFCHYNFLDLSLFIIKIIEGTKEACLSALIVGPELGLLF